MLKKVIGSVFIFSLLGCGSDQNSNLLGLADSANANNSAVLIGAPNGLAGVPTDILEMKKIFKENSYNFKFNSVKVIEDASIQEVLDLTKETALNANTLFWYFSGHGDTGQLLANDGTFSFGQVASAIKKARHNKPLDRLIVVLDSCYSGSFVDGSSPIIEENGKYITKKELAENIMQSFISKDENLYKQAFVFASSTKYQTSEDDGAEHGGAFTYSMRRTLKRLNELTPEVTIEKFAQDTQALTEKEYSHQPVWKAYPTQTVLQDKLFIYK